MSEENRNEEEVKDEVKEGTVIEGFEENKFVKLFNLYGGAVIGGVIAFILCCTRIYMLLVYILIIVAGVFAGDYIQKNKEKVKDKIKSIIDKV